MPRDASTWSLERYIDFALLMSGSPFTVGVVDQKPKTVHSTPTHGMPVLPKTVKIIPVSKMAATMPVSKMATAMPVSKMFKLPAPVFKMAYALPAPVIQRANATTTPALKRAVVSPAPVIKMAFIPALKPLHKMAVTPETLHKMAASPINLVHVKTHLLMSSLLDNQTYRIYPTWMCLPGLVDFTN